METIWWKYTQRIWWWKIACGFHWTKRIISSYNLIKLQIQMFIVLISVAWFHCCYENCDLSWTIFSSMREWRSWWDFFTLMELNLCVFKWIPPELPSIWKSLSEMLRWMKKYVNCQPSKAHKTINSLFFFENNLKASARPFLSKSLISIENLLWMFCQIVLISTFCLLCTILNITFGKYLVIAKNTTIVALSLSLSLRSCQHDFGCAINISQTNDEFATPF